MSELQLIAVPCGYLAADDTHPRRALLRLLVLPHLTDGTLASNGLGSWPPPELRGPLRLFFRSGPGAAESAPVAAETVVSEQPGLWAAMMRDVVVAPRPALVVPEDDDPAASTVVAPTVTDAAHVTDTYATAAAKVTGVDQPGEAGAVLTQANAKLAEHWAAPEAPAPPTTGATRPAADPKDLGTVLGLLREFPPVLRALGLIVELRVDAAAVPSYAGGEGQVRIDWPGAEPALLPPTLSRWSVFDHDHFLPAGDPELEAGMVRLDEAPWSVHTVDADAAAQRLRKAASGAGPVDSLPALRTAGLALARADRADVLARRAGAARAAARARTARALGDAVETTALTAGDLVLGYRLDVSRASTTKWYSLCQRHATYSVVDGEQTFTIDTPEVEEGHVKAHAATRTDGVLRASQVVATWTGWSLAVPDPRRTTVGSVTSAEQAPVPYTLNWEFTPAPARMLPLRFGANYVLRARVADIAGGGLTADDPLAERNQTGPTRYARHEPVLPPSLGSPVPASEEPPTDGHAAMGVRIDRLVVRSHGGADPAADAPFDTTAYDVERALVPPIGSVDLATGHGVLKGTATATWSLLEPFAAGDAELRDCAGAGVTARSGAEPGGPSASIRSDGWATPWPEPDSKSVQLVARTDPLAELLAWQDGRLTVTLARAEEVHLELSSTLPEVPLEAGDSPTPAIRLDEFELATAAGPGEGQTAVALGRHPLVSPARTVTLVHAVIRPLEDPAGRIEATRDAGEVVARLDAPGLLGVDAASTAQVDVSASWTEHDDMLATPVKELPVQSLVVSRGDTTFSQPLRHAFSDTRHRAVTYTVTAVSRFQEYFRDVEPADFLATTTLPDVVHVCSTTRPPPPVLRSVVPGFLWSEEPAEPGGTLVRRRAGGRIRVELARPWYATGEGEQLAVVASSSEVARDPISTRADGAPVDQHLGSETLSSGTWARLSSGLLVAGHEVWPSGDSWYADVVVPGLAERLYCPMVRLSVGRFQPWSVDGLELSDLVQSDFVPILPDRELRVDRSFPGLALVSLTGTGPDNRVDVLLESRDPEVPEDAAVSLGADHGGAWTVVAAQSTRLGSSLDVALTALPSGRPARLRIREVEEHAGTPAAALGTAEELAERVVFTDLVPLG